jgi:hypothetical protein
MQARRGAGDIDVAAMKAIKPALAGRIVHWRAHLRHFSVCILRRHVDRGHCSEFIILSIRLTIRRQNDRLPLP